MTEQNSAEPNSEEMFAGTMEVPERTRFDEAALQAYMEEHVEGFTGNLEVEQFRGGQSNPTYKLQAGGTSYVMRRKPPGELLPSAHAVDREFKVISALQETDVPVAKTYCLCTDESIVGTWFYIQEHVEGRIFWLPSLPDMTPDQRGPIFDAMNDAIAKLHNVDVDAVGLGDFGKRTDYIARQINRWSKQYKASETEDIPAMNNLMTWLPDNMPTRDECSVVHGDYRLDNMIFHPTEPRVLAILDWELATLGDPIADFTYNCQQWYLPPDLFNGLLVPDLAETGIPPIEDYVSAYCRRTGREKIENFEFYIAYNLFRLAGIMQGIMGRYVDGTASSDYAKNMGEQAKPVAEVAWALAKKI